MWRSLIFLIEEFGLIPEKEGFKIKVSLIYLMISSVRYNLIIIYKIQLQVHAAKTVLLRPFSICYF